MRKIAKASAIFAVTAVMTTGMAMTAMAGQWVQDQKGWRYQKHDGSWEVINPDSVGNGTVTATFTSLSPIAFVAYNASAQTGETTPVLPIIVLICVAGIAVCGAKVKFNN